MAYPIRGEQWKLGWCPEVSYGVDPSTAGSGYTNFFGVVQDATLPDIQTDFQPFYGLGTNSVRNWYVMYRGKQQMSGSISNFLMLDGKCLYLAFGGTSAAPVEANLLPSFSMHAGYVDTNGDTALRRRFHGGKVNRMTISANEGGFLTASIDEMMFSAYHQNATASTAFPSASATYSALTDIPPTTEGAGTATPFTCDQPWLFSQGSLQLWGTTFARVRNFRLSVNNACQAKYYITDTAADQLPYEIREGKRDYSMSCTIDIEDSSIYSELVSQGVNALGELTGFQTIISFTRADGDHITITSPTATPACGGDSQGCFIRQAPHNISTGENLLGVPITIMMRSVGIHLG